MRRVEARLDGLAGCLTRGGGSSSVQKLLVTASGTLRARRFTKGELRRLMGLPADYVLPDAYGEAYALCGDGVAPPAVAWLAAHLLEPLVRAARAEERKHGARPAA